MENQSLQPLGDEGITPEDQKIADELLADENPRLVRFVALMTAVVGADTPVVIDPPPLEWELQIAQRLHKELFTLAGLPVENEQRMFGSIVGLMLFNRHAVKILDETFGEKGAESLRKFKHNLRNGFLSGLVEVLDEPNDEIADFFHGMAIGTKAKLGDDWRGFQLPNAILYFVLILLRDKVVACKSVSSLHNFLTTELEGLPVPDLEAFQRFCRRIKLRLNSPGRSPKTN